jgi:hypothetical protein
MRYIVPRLEDITPGPIDDGQTVGCLTNGCSGRAAIMWVDWHNPWISVLCAEHGRESLPSTWIIANPVFFRRPPPDVRALAVERVAVLRHAHERGEGPTTPAAV